MRTPIQVTPDQAAYVLRHLLEQRRIAPTDVAWALAQMQNEIRDLEARLTSLRGVAASGGQQARTKRRGLPVRASRQRSDAQRASFREQGEYLNLLRHLSPKERARYKKVAKEHGRSAAIKQLRAAKSGSR